MSIIIPCYNGEKYIKHAIESVVRQSYKNLEIIVVDDASTDDSPSIIREEFSNERLVYRRNEKNLGIPTSRNIGVKHSKGEYIVFLDQDDILLPDYVNLHLERFANCIACGIVYSDYIQWHEDLGKRKRVFSPRPLKPKHFLEGLFLHRFNIGTLTAMVRRDVFNSIGNLDEGLSITDDYEYWLRVVGRFQVKKVNSPLAIKRMHESNTFTILSQNIFEEELIITSNLVEKYPELRRLKRKRDSSILINWAIFLMKSGNSKEARRQFLLSINEKKRLTNYAGFCLTILGKPGRYIITLPRWAYAKVRYFANIIFVNYKS